MPEMKYWAPGAVSAYTINRMTGDLTLLNASTCRWRSGSCQRGQVRQVSFRGRVLGSYFEVFPILANGSLGPAVFQQQDLGNVDTSLTTKPATSAPPGSFAFSAHEGPDGHPHQMEADPSNQWVVGTDAGQDRIYVWKLTLGATPPLTPAAIPFVNTPPGDGPRHFAFHPNGVWMYSIQEEAIHHHVLAVRSRYGSSYRQQQIIRAFRQDSPVRISLRKSAFPPTAEFVYGANRLNDTIGVFRIGRDGRLTQVSHASTLGDYPRIFTIDPSGRFMAVANQRADNVTTFSD